MAKPLLPTGIAFSAGVVTVQTNNKLKNTGSSMQAAVVCHKKISSCDHNWLSWL